MLTPWMQWTTKVSSNSACLGSKRILRFRQMPSQAMLIATTHLRARSWLEFQSPGGIPETHASVRSI